MCCYYIDDILVFMSTIEEHTQYFLLILYKYREYKLYAKNKNMLV
jgi:hypothetical protein